MGSQSTHALIQTHTLIRFVRLRECTQSHFSPLPHNQLCLLRPPHNRLSHPPKPACFMLLLLVYYELILCIFIYYIQVYATMWINLSDVKCVWLVRLNKMQVGCTCKHSCARRTERCINIHKCYSKACQ